jgi:hypothetical protein
VPAIVYTPDDSETLNSFRQFIALDTPRAKVGTFALPTVAGSLAVTGVGFTPTLIVLMGIGRSAWPGEQTRAVLHFGAATATDQWALGLFRDNGSATASQVLKQDKCISSVFSTTVEFEAGLTSLDSDGFTLDVTTAPGTAWLVAYLAIDHPDVAVGSGTCPVATGTQAISGMGFAPDAFLTAFGSHIAYAVDASNCIGGFGGADAAAQYAVWGGAHDVDNFITGRYDSGDVITFASDAVAGGGAGTMHSQASLQSLDSDGVTLNWHTQNDGFQRIYHWIGLKDADLVRFLFPTNTAPAGQIIATGVPPKALIGYGNGQTTDGAWSNGFGLGVSLGTCAGAVQKCASMQVVDRGAPAAAGKYASRAASDRSFGSFRHLSGANAPDTFMVNECLLTSCVGARRVLLPYLHVGP